jgi:ADP-ribose pyrophosphatase
MIIDPSAINYELSTINLLNRSANELNVQSTNQFIPLNISKKWSKANLTGTNQLNAEQTMTTRINSRQIVHRSRVFNLIRENVTLANGVTTDLEFVEHPGATAIVPLLDESRILLLKQYRHALRDYIWEIPAGTLDPQESVMNCAERELIEETGYSAGQWQKLGEITPVPGYSNERIHIFLASGLQPARQHLDQDEIIKVHEIEFDQVLKMIKGAEIQDAKSITGLFLAFNWLREVSSR